MKKLVFYASLVYAIVFIGVLILHPGGPALTSLLVALQGHAPDAAQIERLSFWYKAFQNTYQIIPPLFAGICGLMYVSKGVHDSDLRRLGWISIGLAALSSRWARRHGR